MPSPVAPVEVSRHAASVPQTVVPLCVDLDGTLILTDVLLESTLLLIKRNPFYVFLLPIWLLRSRAALKAEVAARVTLDPAALPYNSDFVHWLESQRRAGRILWLCTASNEAFAQQIAVHLGIFRGVLASDRRINLLGEKKAARLIDRFGAGGFDYCGNERRDIAIWRHARGAIVVNGSRRLQVAAARHATVLEIFPRRAGVLQTVARALRRHR